MRNVYYLAADPQTLAIRCNGNFELIPLKSWWFGRGLTKSQAINRAIASIGGFPEKPIPWWRNSYKSGVFGGDEISAFMFNDPPLEAPLQFREFYSLDSAATEMWFRKVFRKRRRTLPAIVHSVQQHYQVWLKERWTAENSNFSSDLERQAEQAEQVHDMVSQLFSARIAEAQQAQQTQLSLEIQRGVEILLAESQNALRGLYQDAR